MQTLPVLFATRAVRCGLTSCLTGNVMSGIIISEMTSLVTPFLSNEYDIEDMFLFLIYFGIFNKSALQLVDDIVEKKLNIYVLEMCLIITTIFLFIQSNEYHL